MLCEWVLTLTDFYWHLVNWSLDLPPLYNGLSNALRLLQSAQLDQAFSSLWFLEDLLYSNPIFPAEALSSGSLFSVFSQAMLTKLSHLIVPS